MENVRHVMYDFENATKLSPAVLETEVYRYDDNTARVTAIMRPCVYIFCKTMEKLTIVNLEENRIHLQGIEDAGSFRNSNEVIKYAPQGQGTNIRYKGDLSPRFFLPSWLGVRFIRATVPQVFRRHVGKHRKSGQRQRRRIG